MEDKILRQLHNLRSIAPDPAFMARSRSSILKKTKSPFFARPLLAYAGAFAVILIVVGFSIIFPSQTSKPSLSSLNALSLNQELKNLSINIQLEEISYQQSVNQTIASALGEISDSRTGHLSPLLLESERKSAELEIFSNPEIEELLNDLLF